MHRASLLGQQRAQRWNAALFQFDRNVYLLLLFTLGKGFQISITAVSINLYVHSLGYSLEFVGLVTGMPAIGSLLAAVPAGMLADRLGRKPLLILSGLLNPLSLVAIGLSTNAPFLLGASVLNGLLSASYWVTNIPMLTESSASSARVWVLSLNNFLLLGLGSLGGLLGGAVPEWVGALTHHPATSMIPLRWGVLVAAVIVFLPSLPLFFLRETGRAATTRGSDVTLAVSPATTAAPDEAAVSLATGEDAASRGDAASDEARREDARTLVPLFLKLLIPDALYTTGLGAAIGLLQLFLLLRFHVQPGALGVLYAVAGFVGGAASLIAAQVERRIGRLNTITTLQYLAVPFVLLIGFAPAFVLAASGDFAYNILAGIFAPVYAVFTLEQVSARHRATLSGFYSVTWSVGFSIGPALAGWLQTRVGLSAGFVASACFIVLAATLLRVFFGREARPPAASSASTVVAPGVFS